MARYGGFSVWCLLVWVSRAAAAAPEWTPYNSREENPSTAALDQHLPLFLEMINRDVMAEWSDTLRVSVGDLHRSMTLVGDSKVAVVERLIVDKTSAQYARGTLTDAQLKKLLDQLYGLRFWALRHTDRDRALGEKSQRSNRRLMLAIGNRQTVLDIIGGCPCQACDCPQLKLIQVLEGLSAIARPAMPPATTVMNFRPPASKVAPAPIDGECSDQPSASKYFTCRTGNASTRVEYAHCLDRGNGQFSCYASPFDPEVRIRKRETCDLAYVPPNRPWAIELASTERCVLQFPQWRCNSRTTFQEALSGKVWVVVDDVTHEVRPVSRVFPY